MAGFDGVIRVDTKIDQSGVNKGLKEMESSCNGFANTVGAIFAGISIGSFAAAALKSTSDIELAQVKLTTLLGSADMAQTMINDIVKMADTTPYNSNDLIQAATTLKTFGITAQDMMPTLTALGNAAGGQAENLKGIAYALGQTAAQGKMMTQDLYQFINAGVPLLDLLAKQLNKSKREIKGMIEQGAIGYKEVNAALQEFYTGNGKYANLMAQAAQTLPGLWSSFQDAIMSFGRAVVSIFEGSIKTALQTATKIFQVLAAAVNNLSQPAKNVLSSFGGAIAIFTGLAVAIGVATTAFRTLFTVLRTNPFMLIISLIGTLIVKLMDLGDATQNLMGLTQEEFDRMEKIYKQLSKRQKEATDAGNVEQAKKNYAEMTESLEYYTGQLKKMTPESADWLQTVGQAAALSKSLESQKTLGFVTSEDAQKAEELKNKFYDLYRVIRKAHAEGQGKGGYDLGGTGEDTSALQSIWRDYYIWQQEEESGHLAAMLAEEEFAYRKQQEIAKGDTDALQAIAAMHESKKADIYDKWAERHQAAAFLMGFGMTQKEAEGMLAGLHFITSAVKKTVSTIVQTFQVMGEIFQGAIDITDYLVDFDPSKLYDDFEKYFKNLADFIENDLGSLPIWFDAGVAVVTNFLSGIASNLPNILVTLGNVIKHVTDYVVSDFPNVIRQVTGIIAGIVKELLKNAPAIAAALLASVVALVQSLGDESSGLANALFNAVIGTIGALLQYLPQLTQALVVLVRNLLQSIVDNLPALLTTLLQAIDPIIKIIVQMIAPLTVAIIKALPQIIDAIVLALPDLVQAIVELLPMLVVEIVKALPQIVVALVDAIAHLVIISQGRLIKSIAKSHMIVFEKVAEVWGKAGKAVVDGFVKGVTDYFPRAIQAVVDAFNYLVRRVKSLLGIHSPSTVFYSIGVDVVRGLINGVTSLLQSLFSLGSSIASSLADGISAALSMFTNIGANILSELLGGMKSMFQELVDFASRIGSAIGSAMVDALNAALGTAGDTLGGIVQQIYEGVGGWFNWDPPDWFASGTDFAPGGMAMVGERGPELVNLPRGSSVLTAAKTMSLLSALNNFSGSTLAATGSGVSVSVDISAADVKMDGDKIGQITFKRIDKYVKGAYGIR